MERPIKLLFEFSRDYVNSIDSTQSTALNFAIEKGNEEYASILLRHGAYRLTIHDSGIFMG